MLIRGGDDFTLNEELFCLEVTQKSNSKYQAEEEILPLTLIEDIIKRNL